MVYYYIEVIKLLIEFKFKNYRSFRDETVLSMEATGLGTFKSCLIEYGSTRLMPGAAIYGKNGGGKSNVIRAFWLAVQFIRNAQRTQHENASVPVSPFAFDDYSFKQPTSFEFTFVLDNVKYIYGFSATKEKILTEYLYHSPNGQKAIVFERSGQTYKFTENKAKRKLISEAVAQNQLFFSVACTMNDVVCVTAMRWFRDYVLFSRDYSDIPRNLLEYSNNKNMLTAISNYARSADLGIVDMQFEFNSEEVSDTPEFPENIPEGIRVALINFMHALSDSSISTEVTLRKGEVTATSIHRGVKENGEEGLFPGDLSDESDGTRKLMALAPAIESVLEKGGVLLVDELERELHPMLVQLIVSKFQSKRTNPYGAQIIFTTHNTDLMNEDILRKDQLYFVDKDSATGVSELYSISEFSTKTTENIRKGYLAGKYGATPDIEIEEVE